MRAPPAFLAVSRVGVTSLRLVAVGLVLAASGCNYVPPGTTLQRHYKTSIPAGVKVERYYCDAYKDPQFLWVMTPVNPGFVAALVANARLKPAAAGDGLGHPGGGSLASWWDDETIQKIPELYYRDPDANDGSYYRVWVDRERNRIYILFSNT
jgi:hypothetical protein